MRKPLKIAAVIATALLLSAPLARDAKATIAHSPLIGFGGGSSAGTAALFMFALTAVAVTYGIHSPNSVRAANCKPGMNGKRLVVNVFALTTLVKTFYVTCR